MKVDVENLSKKEWCIEHFDGCPAFTEMTGGGFTHQLEETGIPVYTLNTCFYEDREGDWMTLVSDQKQIGSTIVSKFLKDNDVLERLYKKWQDNFRLMMENYYISFRKDISILDDSELWAWADGIYDFYKNKMLMPGFIDGFMFYADKRFDDIVKKFCDEHSIKNYPEIYSILSSPIEPSFINEEEEDLKKIIKSYPVNKISEVKESLEFKNILSNHLFKYSWIKSSYTGYREYTFQDALAEIENLIEKNNLDKNSDHFLKNNIEKEKLIEKYGFTDEILAIAKITERLIKWQDERKIYTLTFVSLQEKILKEISKRSGINLELLRYCCIVDIKEALDRKMDSRELEERQKGVLFVYENGNIIDLIIGKDALKFLKEVSEVDADPTNEIKGITASLGKARGQAKIVISAKQIDKVNEGDILIATMTRPEHLPAMKKAAAIVTDDGGITCHAAIVARELKKPCIIGTKIATKVFKDGDEVEVDANHGLTRKIS